jgi:hypothetical protein
MPDSMHIYWFKLRLPELEAICPSPQTRKKYQASKEFIVYNSNHLRKTVCSKTSIESEWFTTIIILTIVIIRCMVATRQPCKHII